MQHIWEFLVVLKPTPEEVKPEPINRYFVTESGRRSKATKKMYETLKKDYGINEQALENFLVRQIR